MLKTLLNFFHKEPKPTNKETTKPCCSEGDSKRHLATKLHTNDPLLVQFRGNVQCGRAHWHTNTTEQQYQPPQAGPDPAVEVYCKQLKLNDEDNHT